MSSRSVQGAYKSGKPGKPGNVREFCNSGKLRENSGNLKCTQGIFKNIICCFFRDAVIYNLVPLNGYSGTTAASDPPDFGGCNNGASYHAP